MNYHILNGLPDGNRYGVAFHLPVPDTDNGAGVNHRMALMAYLGGSQQSRVPFIATEEQTRLDSGELYEYIWTYKTHSGVSLGEKQAELDAKFAAFSAAVSILLEKRLVYWGFNRNVWIDLIDDPYAAFEKLDIPRPGYLEPITDPVFGTKITRITGDPGDTVLGGTWGAVARHWYSKVQPWNADESLIYLYFNTGGTREWGLLLDGQTYEPISFPDLPTSRVRWHPTDPDLMIYAIGNEIGYFNVVTGKKTVLREFPGYILTLAFMGEGNVSFDGRMALLHAYKGSVLYIFAYDLENDIVYPELDTSSFDAYGQTWSCYDWGSISPSGQYIIVYWHNTWQQVYDLNMNLIVNLQWPTSHMDVGVDENGDEVAMGHTAGWYVCNEGTLYVNGTGTPTDKYKGQLTKQRLPDGATTQLTWGDNYALSHTSGRNGLRPGWAYNWYSGYGDSVFRDEIVAVKTDGSFSVQRFCHLHNIKTDYYSEAHPCPAPDGRRVLFASNWDESSGRPVGAYVVDARA